MNGFGDCKYIMSQHLKYNNICISGAKSCFKFLHILKTCILLVFLCHTHNATPSSLFRSIKANHPLALLTKACFPLRILLNPPTIHMPLTIFPLAKPPAHLIPALLQEIAPLITPKLSRFLVDVLTAHVWREPGALQGDGLGG